MPNSIEFISQKFHNYYREIKDPNSATYKLTLLKLIMAIALVSISIDQLIELLTYFATGGTHGRFDTFYLVIFLLSVVVFALTRRKRTIFFAKQLFLFTFIILSMWLYGKYQDFAMPSILLTTSIFLAGYLMSPIYSIIYGGLFALTYLLLTAGNLDTNYYISVLMIITFASLTSYLMTILIKSMFRANNTMAGKLLQLYENDQQLFSQMAHRLKTPLTILKTEIELYTTKIPAAQGNISSVIDEINRAIMELTSISKVNLSNVGKLRYPVSLDMLVESISKDAEILARNYNGKDKRNGIIHYKTDDQSSPHIAKVAPDQIREAILNVIDNSFAHNPTKDITVFLSIRKKGTNHYITIIDNGGGIPDQKLKDILSGKNNNKKLNNNYRIGLQLVRNLVRANDGQVNIHSKPDKGTKIEIVLPSF